MLSRDGRIEIESRSVPSPDEMAEAMEHLIEAADLRGLILTREALYLALRLLSDEASRPPNVQ